MEGSLAMHIVYLFIYNNCAAFEDKTHTKCLQLNDYIVTIKWLGEYSGK